MTPTEIREAKEVIKRIKNTTIYGIVKSDITNNALSLALKALSIVEGLPSKEEIKTIIDENICKGGNTKSKLAHALFKRQRGEK